MKDIVRTFSNLESLIAKDEQELRLLKRDIIKLESRIELLMALQELLTPQLEEERQKEIKEALDRSERVGFVETEYKMPENYTRNF